MTRSGIVWTAVIGIIVVLSIAAGWSYLVFVHGSRTSIPLGGQWELEVRSTPMSHGGGDATLYRRHGWRRTLVDELVYTNQYYGDDCVAYTTTRGGFGRSYYAACGDREPVLIGHRVFETKDGEAHLREFRIDPDGVTEIQTTSSQKVERKLPVSEIKRRALAQPPLKEGWYAKQWSGSTVTASTTI